MMIDTHAHYDDEQYNDDRENLLREIFSAKIEKVVNSGATVTSTKESVKLAHTYEKMYATIGVHPSEIDEVTEEFYDYLRETSKDEKVVAIGEIGLDYYWEKDPEVRKKQQEVFRRQLELAYEVNLPVVVHSRDAAEDTMKILKEAKPREIPGIIHCYAYSVEMAREYVKMGYYLGVGGVVTFKNSKVLKEVVKEVGVEHLVLETDSPYLSPEPHRGTRNSSLNIPYIVEKIAELTDHSVEEVERITTENACRVYGF